MLAGLPPSPSPYGQPGKTVYGHQTRGRNAPRGSAGQVAPSGPFGDDHRPGKYPNNDPHADTVKLQRWLIANGYKVSVNGNPTDHLTMAAAAYFRKNHMQDPNSGRTWSVKNG